jgi:hypothetical protein
MSGKDDMQLTPAMLRRQSREHRRAAEIEADPRIKRKLAIEALTLAELAEQLERTDRFVTAENIQRYKSMLADVLDDAQRRTLEELLSQEQAKLRK